MDSDYPSHNTNTYATSTHQIRLWTYTTRTKLHSKHIHY